MRQSATARGGRPPRIRPDEILDLLTTRVDDSWTMAGLASELGVSEAAIYYYFSTKADLLLALGQRLFSDLALPRLQGDWEAWLAEVGLCMYDFYVSFPAMTGAGLDLLGDAASEALPTESILTDLASAGFAVSDADTVITTVMVLASGYAGMHVYLDGPRGQLLKQRAVQRAEGQPTTLTAQMQLASGAWDIRQRFAASLRATIAGLHTLRAT